MKKYLLSRPVNSLRKIYEPAFLGAKLQAQDATMLQLKILEGSLKKKLNSSEDWAYKNFFVFKGLNEDGDKEYRKCLAPSPTTATAEAYLLNQLSGIKKHLRLSNVYSYCLAEQNSATNYQYYLSYYQKKNEDVLISLQESEKTVAVTFDIRKFYPSIDQDLLRKKLSQFAHQFRGLTDLTEFVNFSLHQVDRCESGIPIGTEISHQLADLYLRDLDKQLSERFDGKYFRYVDDITIVCDRSKLNETNKYVQSKINEIGLDLNPTKFSVLDAVQWRSEMFNQAVDGEDFFQHCGKLSHWLKVKNIDEKEISRQFRNEGFNLPFEKIVARRPAAIDGNTAELTTSEVIEKTKDLKEKYKNAAESMVGLDPEDHSRGSLQKARRALNPLFYLLDVSEYDLISEVASTHHNLITQKIVSDAFHDEIPKVLLDYPGTTVSSYCEISKTLGRTKSCELAKINVESIDKFQRDSVTALLLHGLVSFDARVGVGKGWEYLRPNVEHRTIGVDKFEAEIEALRICLSVDEQSEIINRRQNEDEEIDLQALELGNQTISP